MERKARCPRWVKRDLGGRPLLAQKADIRLRLDKDDILKHVPESIPTPRMPADLYIKTGERTFFEYIVKPVLDSLSRGFRET
jgi:hypothetical protein